MGPSASEYEQLEICLEYEISMQELECIVKVGALF